jgi:hypothetical protein
MVCKIQVQVQGLAGLERVRVLVLGTWLGLAS